MHNSLFSDRSKLLANALNKQTELNNYQKYVELNNYCKNKKNSILELETDKNAAI
jgi:hypothetical protein